LISRDASAPTVQILIAVLRGELNVRVSAALVAEYRGVLKRPRIAKHHGLSDGQVDDIVDAIVGSATLVDVAEWPAEGPDPNDVHLWRLLRSVGGATLITGDQALIEHAPAWCAVLTPRNWWTRYSNR